MNIPVPAASMIKRETALESIRKYQRLKKLANRAGLSKKDLVKFSHRFTDICELLEVHKLKPYEIAEWLQDEHELKIEAAQIKKTIKILSGVTL